MDEKLLSQVRIEVLKRAANGDVSLGLGEFTNSIEMLHPRRNGRRIKLVQHYTNSHAGQNKKLKGHVQRALSILATQEQMMRTWYGPGLRGIYEWEDKYFLIRRTKEEAIKQLADMNIPFTSQTKRERLGL